MLARTSSLIILLNALLTDLSLPVSPKLKLFLSDVADEDADCW